MIKFIKQFESKNYSKKVGDNNGILVFFNVSCRYNFVDHKFSNKEVSRSTKFVIACFVLGILLVIGSLLLFLPGSSSIIEQLLQLN